MQVSNNKILITGGATGIGLGLAQRFVQEGSTVIICGRREEALDAAKESTPGLITRICNLSNAQDRVELRDWVAGEHPDLNVLVNNAGIQLWMDVSEEGFFEKASGEIETNISAPLHLSALFLQLPALKTIVNVTSGLSFAPFVKVPVYSATKAFLHSFTWSLRHMLKDKGIEVIELIPPALNTDLGGKGLHDQAPPVSEFVDSVFRDLKEGKTEISFGTSAGRAEAVRAAVIDAFNAMNP